MVGRLCVETYVRAAEVQCLRGTVCKIPHTHIFGVPVEQETLEHFVADFALLRFTSSHPTLFDRLIHVSRSATTLVLLRVISIWEL